VRSYQSHWTVVRKAFGDRVLLDFDAPTLDAWFDRQLSRVRPQTVYHYRQLLIRTFNVAIKLGRYPYANPAAATDPIELPETERRRLVADELPRLLDACKVRKGDLYWYRFFGTLFLTGLRFAEGSLLQWADFDWERMELTPSHQKSSRRKDVIVFGPELEAVLGPVARPNSKGLVFPSSTGEPVQYKTALNALRRLAKEAGISDYAKLGLHATRRTTVTAAEKAASGNINAFLRVSRHQDLKTARRYLPAVPDDARQVFLETSRAIGEKMGVVLPFKKKAAA
jgi:integrase